MSQVNPQALNHYRTMIRERYPRRFPELYTFSPEILVPTFREAIRENNEDAIRRLLHPVGPQVYAFEMLVPEFCDKLIEETEAFGDWCTVNDLHKNVPNTMNNYGAVLDDFGFTPFLDELMQTAVLPLSRFLYPDVVGATLDNHHGFVVDYEMGKDEHLDFHVDQSDVTLNVCLGQTFTDGNLYFGGIRCAVHQQTMPRPEEAFTVQHQPGQALLHRGKHRHAAENITAGRRMNLILWCMSSTYQNQYDSHACTQWCCWQPEADS